MKKIRFLVSLVAVAIVVSCQQENKLEQFDNEVKKENIVSLETAKDVAFFYLHKNKNVPNTRSRQADEVKIESSFSINDENAEPVMHVVNYEGGGFAIISGDNRIEPMLAYSDDGVFDDNEQHYPKGLVAWINNKKEIIKYIRTNDVALPKELKTYWEICASVGKSRAIPEQELDCEEGEIFDDYIAGPLLTTEWDQTSPYNIFLPMVNLNGNEKRAYVGCSPLAIAQLLRYWEHPTTYNWYNMPNDYPTIDTWNLIDYIHSVYKEYDEGFNYNWNGTDANHTYIDEILKNEFDYKSAIEAVYSSSVVQYELLANQRPVILRGVSSGVGHVWVCDGAHRWNVCLPDDVAGIAVGYLHFHMNWGWGGSYNGWYSSNNFSIPTKGDNYNSGLKMIYNIVPNN